MKIIKERFVNLKLVDLITIKLNFVMKEIKEHFKRILLIILTSYAVLNLIVLLGVPW